MDYYEAVIVGGGPAGLMAAKKAAENGAQVLLLEKGSHFGRKVCAGGITKQGLVDSEIPTSLDFIENEIFGAKDLANLANGLDAGRIVEMLLKHPLLSSRVCSLLLQEAS